MTVPQQEPDVKAQNLTRIEVRPRRGLPDPLGRRAAGLLGLPPSTVSGGKVYYLGANLAPAEARQVAADFLADPLAEEIAVGDDPAPDAAWEIEVGLRPGVTDNEGRVATEILSEALGRPLAVHSARLFRFRDAGGGEAFGGAACGALGNPLIERFRVSQPLRGEVAPGWSFADGAEPAAPGRLVETVELPDDASALATLSRAGMLSLSVPELQAIRAYFARPEVALERHEVGLPEAAPTDVELEAIAQTWSEHCKHKIFNDRIRYRGPGGERDIASGLFATFIRGATAKIRAERDFLVSVFEDNAGVVRFDADHHLVFKVETHNSPSALEPYGGALTGIVGVNRDPAGTGLGCRLVFNTDVFCLAPPLWPFPLPAGALHPERIMAGVRKGVEDGGNQSGIPTVNGAVYFDPRFIGRPLVFCGTGGLMPRTAAGRAAHEKSIVPGDLVVMAGGRVGRDGIHGATFSSAGLEAETPIGVVQIGDPITQKRLLDLLAEARDLGLYRALTDNGAGGLSSSAGELALLSGGCELALDQVPPKAAGLRPWEILVSESQERMTLAVPPDCWPRLAALARRRGVEVSRIGRFTGSGRLVCTWEGREVARLDLLWLHQTGLPARTLEAEWQGPAAFVAGGPMPGERPAPADDPVAALLALLGSLNICSRERLVRQYDHEVQGGSVVKPLVGRSGDGPADAAVLRPLLDSVLAVAVSNGLAPQYGDGDPYWMAACAVDEAVRNAVAVGADPGHLALLDNFCWPDPVYDPTLNPDGRLKLGALVRACEGLHDAAVAYGTPLISGKDSVKNDFFGHHDGTDIGVAPAALGAGTPPGTLKLSIAPTLLVSAIGVVPDHRDATTMDFKLPDDRVYVVGPTRDERGGSQWARLAGYDGGDVPTVDFALARRIYEALHRAMRDRLVTACHDVSEGGLAVALAECALAGELGVACDLAAAPGCSPLPPEAILFSESAGRVVVTIAPADCERFEALMAGLPCARIGHVTADRSVDMAVHKTPLVRASVAELKRAWQETPQW